MRKAEELDQLEREVHDARQVRSLQDRYLDNFFRKTEQNVMDHIRDIAPGDAEALLVVHYQYLATLALRDELESVITTGKMAQLILNIDKKS